MPTMSPRGTIQPKRKSRQKVLSTRPENSILCCSSSLTSEPSSIPGMRVVVKVVRGWSTPTKLRTLSPGPGCGAGSAPGLRVPRISRSVSETFSTLPSRTSCRNLLIGISTVRGASSQLWTSDRTTTAMSR